MVVNDVFGIDHVHVNEANAFISISDRRHKYDIRDIIYLKYETVRFGKNCYGRFTY